MDPNLEEEWAVLRLRAIANLGNEPDLPRWTRRIALVLVMPSFADAISYDVREWTKGRAGYVVVRTAWRMSTDAAKFESPVARLRFPPVLEPTMECRDVVPDQARLKNMLAELTGLLVPLPAHSRIAMLDGTRHVVRLGDALTGCELTWSTSPPSGWEALQKFVDNLKRLVNAADESAG